MSSIQQLINIVLVVCNVALFMKLYILEQIVVQQTDILNNVTRTQ